MSSDKGPIATEGPVVPAAVPEASPGLSAEAFATDPGRSRSLKRTRESTPHSTSPTASIDGLSPSKIARLVGFARDSPVPPPLTGAAAIEDDRLAREEGHRPDVADTSENPGQRVLSDLMAGVEAMSRLQDAPSSHNTAATHTEFKEISSQSSSGHAASLEHGSQVARSPNSMDVEHRAEQRLYAPQPDAQMEDRTAAASLSYPGVLQPGASLPSPAAPQRGMTAPTGAPQAGDAAPRSPSSKKHKCPYCDTEFTRHHNLKSHLLTHSQEKPYVCQTCSLRFRRLHDLKRHSKLHTGEKPHVCPKCDRKFARGDALARHSKGAGGCAGRRTSMGSFAGDDDFEGTSATDVDDSVMSGLAYADGATDPDMVEEERRSLSLPSIKAPQSGHPESYNAHSHTYPPAGQRPSASGALFAQNVDQNPTGTSSPPNVPNASTVGAAGARGSNIALPGNPGISLFAQGGIAESPKPISPAAVEGQPRPMHSQYRVLERPDKGAPLSTHGTSEGHKGWVKRYPPADGSSQGNATAAQPGGSSIPANTTATTATAATATTVTPAPGPVDNANNLFASGEQGMWAYMQHLDDKVKQLMAEVDACHDQMKQLTEEVESSRQTEARLSEQIVALTAEVESLRQPMT